MHRIIEFTFVRPPSDASLNGVGLNVRGQLTVDWLTCVLYARPWLNVAGDPFDSGEWHNLIFQKLFQDEVVGGDFVLQVGS